MASKFRSRCHIRSTVYSRLPYISGTTVVVSWSSPKILHVVCGLCIFATISTLLQFPASGPVLAFKSPHALTYRNFSDFRSWIYVALRIVESTIWGLMKPFHLTYLSVNWTHLFRATLVVVKVITPPPKIGAGLAALTCCVFVS